MILAYQYLIAWKYSSDWHVSIYLTAFQIVQNYKLHSPATQREDLV